MVGSKGVPDARSTVDARGDYPVRVGTEPDAPNHFPSMRKQFTRIIKLGVPHSDRNGARSHDFRIADIEKACSKETVRTSELEWFPQLFTCCGIPHMHSVVSARG